MAITNETFNSETLLKILFKKSSLYHIMMSHTVSEFNELQNKLTINKLLFL